MRTALVVDDHEPISDLVASELRDLGYSPRRVPSLSAARKAATDRDFDLVILDLRLPDGSGLGLLRDFARAGCGPTVVIITAHSDEATKDEARSLGAAGYLEKPIDPDELIAMLVQAEE